MKLYIANSAGNLTKHERAIKTAFAKAKRIGAAKLKLDKVDIIAMHMPQQTIAGIGVGGFTPSRNLIYLYCDGQAKIKQLEILASLVHELHHARRYDGPGFGKTLFDTLIFEGLAMCFEQEECGDTHMVKYVKEFKDPQKLYDFLKPSFKNTSFDYMGIFNPGKGSKLPYWAGYVVGYQIVRSYLDKANKTASELVLEKSPTFLTKEGVQRSRVVKG